MYHTYTVDVHSLFLVEQLRRLVRGRFADELPLATELMKEGPSPLVLYLGCILHDIGKGKGGEHPERGAKQVPEICRRLGLGEEEIEDVALLVRHHLTLSGMAERRDVHEFRLILMLANLVGTRARLRNLYLLTVADIRSVSQDAWTTWKAGLLEALYRNTAEWLEAGVEDESAPGFFLQRAGERVRHVEAVAFQQLAQAEVPLERARALLESMPRRYLLSHGPLEIAQHLQAALAYVDSGRLAKVTTFTPEAGEGAFTGLVVFAADRPGLLATMAGVLTACDHDILAAQVYTTRERLAVEIFQVAPFRGGPVERERERLRLEERLTGVLEGAEPLAVSPAAPPRRLPVVRARPPTVEITNEESDFFTIIDVNAVDRPGLLHAIARGLADLGIDVSMSRISTRVLQVTDSFYVTEKGHRILDLQRQKEIEDALLAALRQDAP
jgi:[protein-PII] uridylyltransferase